MYVRRKMSRSCRPQDDDSCIRYIVYGNSIHICKRPVASQEMPEKLDEKALSHSALTAIAHAGLGHVEDVEYCSTHQYAAWTFPRSCSQMVCEQVLLDTWSFC